MIDFLTLKKAWSLLDARERLNAFKVLAVMIAAAIASAVMVGSVFPFLSVLADPSMIERQPLLAWAYETGGFASDYAFLIALGVAALIVIAVANLLLFLNLYATTRYATMRTYSLSRRLLAHYLAQPYDYFLDRHSGDMSTNILTEAQQVVSQFLQPLAGLISATLIILAVMAMLVAINPLVAISTVASFAAIYAAVLITTKRLVRHMGKRRAEVNKQRFRIAGEALSGIKDIKLLGREPNYLDRYSGPAEEMARLQTKFSIFASAPQFAMQIFAFGGIILLCLLLLNPDELQQRSALGDLLPLLGVLAFAGQRLMPQLQAVYGAITQMTYGASAVDRVSDDLRSGAHAKLDRRQSAPLRLRRDLTLDGVSYVYPNADQPSLREVSLRIGAGERIGIVGASGAGKTTLADVVLGLLAPNTGTLRADGTPIAGDMLRAWQNSVGYVPQDIFLVDASLSENIALGFAPGAIDDAKVERAARIAQLHEFITQELPEGYDTLIGERGVRLSGGQRQRIGIARALYHDADLIVFDEATSALDNMTEREVMSAIEALPGDKTVLMIAHRLTTVKVCDRIVVMEKGTVAGCGTWNGLIESTPAFKKIVEAA